MAEVENTVENLPQLIGPSAAMREIAQEILCASRSNAKVLITGESGPQRTGRCPHSLRVAQGAPANTARHVPNEFFVREGGDK